MYAFLFGCVLVLQGVTGNYLFPAWRPSSLNESLDEPQEVVNKTTTKAYYFNAFSLKKLNPVYWFYDSSQADKLDKLYELVKCVIEDETLACREKLQSSRTFFEKKNQQTVQKGVEEKTTTRQESIDSITSERNVQVQSSDVLNKNQVDPDAVSHVSSISPTESRGNATIPGENGYSVPSR